MRPQLIFTFTMPENPDFITEQQYHEYQDAWLALIKNADNEALREAFRAPQFDRLTFLPFSPDQIAALVATPGVGSIKARFLLLPESAAPPRFSVALFASDGGPDTADKCLSEYYIPTPAAATTAPRVEPSPGPDTKIPRSEAVQWLNDWLKAELTTEIFNTDFGPLQGGNFEVSTFQDPLAAAWPYADKSLFLNLGLISDPEPTSALVVYIAPLSSRTQGSMAGLPDDDSYYDGGQLCPPNH